MKQHLTLARAGIAGLAALLLGTSAGAQEACSAYTVKEGDTLGLIAEIAYGTVDYQNIVDANRDTIGDDAASLTAGVVLNLPCEDGSIAGSATAEEVIAEQNDLQAEAPAANAYEPPIKFLAGGDYAPFSDESLEGGGFLVRLAETAMHRAGNNRGYITSFVNDRTAHLVSLLPSGAFDVGLGWYVPNCEKRDMLSDAEKFTCDEFDTTLPVYEPVVGYYTTKDSKFAGATQFSDFIGARVCRMEGYFTFDLEEEGLSPPAIELVRPATPDDCMEALVTGAADVTGMEVQTAAGAIARLGIGEEVEENPNLTKFLSMSFVSHKSNPFGKQYIALLNRGLTEMRKTGEWYAIISSSLTEHNEMVIQSTN